MLYPIELQGHMPRPPGSDPVTFILHSRFYTAGLLLIMLGAEISVAL
jgi:hypothetical protein